MRSKKEVKKLERVAGNHEPSADQGSTTKQHAIEFLKHTHTPSYIINMQIDHVVALNKRNSKIQK